MISLRQKRTSFKTTIILSIVLLVCVAVSLLFGFLQSNEIRNDYYLQTAASAKYLSEDIYAVLGAADKALEDAGSSPYGLPSEIFNDVNGILFIGEGGESELAMSEIVYSGITVKTEELQKLEQNITKANGGVYRDIFLLKNFVEDGINILKRPVYYSVKKTNNGYAMSLLSLPRVFDKVGSNEFDSVRLLANDFTYSFSALDSDFSQDFYSGLDITVKEKLAASEGFAGQVKLYSQNYVMAITPSHGTYGNIRLIVTKSSMQLNALIRSQSARYVIENVAIAFIFSAGFVLLLLLLVKDEGDFQFLNITNGNYAIKVNSAGKILWKNNNFAKKFDYENINACLSLDGKKPSYVLSNCKPVIMDLDDKDGYKHYLVMSIIRYGRTYRLIGSDLTEDISAYKSLSHSDRFDSVTDIQLEWVFINRVSDIIAKGNGIKGALAILRLSNLTMLKIMMGEHLFRQTIMLYAGCLRREFEGLGELYILKNGDFVLLNTDDNTINPLINKLPAIMEKLRRPIALNDNSIQIDGKLGMIILNSKDNNITVNSLLSNAQRALEYAVKAPKQSHYILYPTSFSVAMTNFRADGVVKKMIENKEFEAFFQPQYSLTTNKIVGFEALCRIMGPKSSEINIGELISIAEQYGGMIDLGHYICDRAMAFAAEIQDKNIQVAVNVSPIQLMQAGFTNSFIELFQKHKLKKGVFNIEITESAALYSFDEAVAKLNILRNCGIGIHIDDFGVAYSSMLHLKLLPATLIKIDKSLVDDITDNAEARSIIKNIISLGKDLNLDTIAEGVEQREQMELLRELNCDMIQGYVISKAVPRLAAIEMIKEVNKDG